MIYIVSPGGVREKGGMGRVVDNIACRLAAEHRHIPFAVVDTYGPGSFRLMPLWFACACLRLASAFLFRRARLIHVHMAERGSVLRKGTIMAMAKACGVPIILHLHAGQFHEQVAAAGTLERWALRFVIGLADEMIVLGSFYRDFVETAFAGTVRRVTVLHNAVPGPAVVPVRPNGGPVRLLFLGRLVPIKALHVLIEALASSELRERPWMLTVVGDGDRARYEAMARERGLADRIRFTGWLDQESCRRELAAAEVLVQPSFNEGLPMAVLEAMAHGLAIVATDVGAVTDAVKNGCNGLVIPPRVLPPLVDALIRVIDDGKLRCRLGEQARIDYEVHFHLSGYVERLLDIYRRNARSWPDAPVAPLNACEGAPPT